MQPCTTLIINLITTLLKNCTASVEQIAELAKQAEQKV